MGVIRLAKPATTLRLSESVRFALCFAMKVVFNVVASSLVLAVMTARDCGMRPRRLPSKALTADVSDASELLSEEICSRIWGAKDSARGTCGRASVRGRRVMTDVSFMLGSENVSQGWGSLQKRSWAIAGRTVYLC